MSATVQNILKIVAAGVALLAGFVVLRFVLKLAWKVIRVVLIVLSLLVAAGYFLGYLDIVFK
jgi:hypothetical protein